MKFFFAALFLIVPFVFLNGQATLVEWNFPNDPDDAIADAGITANAAKTISTVAANTAVFTAGGATTNSASATGWDAGSGTKYWMVEVTTTGYSTLTISSKQRSTTTAPRDFIAEYRIGAAGVWTPIPGGTVLTADNYTSGVLTNLALPAACENQASVFIRWVMSSNVAVNLGVVGTGGVSNIDDVIIRGQLISGTTVATDYFRTFKSGIWNDAAVWESSPDNATWVTSSLIPTSAANEITILAPHIVTMDAAASADQLTINAGASLVHNNGIAFTLNDGAGTDMTVFGNYSINGTMPIGTGTVSIEEFASVFALTNTGGQSDNFAYSNRVLFKSNSAFNWSTTSLFDTDGITYFPINGPNDRPRFVINFDMGTVGAGTTTTFNGSLDVRGNITFTGTGQKIFRDGIFTSATKVLTQTATCGQFIMNGVLPNLGGGGIINLNTNGMQIATGSQGVLTANQEINNSTFTVNGDLFAYELQITGSVNFNLTGALFTQHANGISNTGTLATTGTVTLGTASTIVYDRSTTDQQFTSRTDYANVQITGGSRKVLNGAATMSGNLVLSNGLVVTTNLNLLTITATGSSFGVSDVSFVTGPMKKIGNSAFTFPVGKPITTGPASNGSPTVGGYRFIAISAPALATDEFTAEFYLANANLIGSLTASGLVRISSCEYWRLDQTAGTSSVNVTLSWTDKSKCNYGNYISDPATVVVVHNTATGYPFGSGNWDAYGRDGGNTGIAASGTVTWNNVSTFSPFTIGTTDQSANLLPFKLTSFTVTPKQQTVLINWVVANNNDQQEYILERSKDAIHFETTLTVTAKANSVIADYNYTDAQPLSGWNYYRLRAKDHQNKTQVSSIVKVWMGKGAFISLLPNPASEKIVIHLSGPSSIQQLQLVNTVGQVLRQLNTIQFLNEINISNLQAGIYYIRFLGKDGLTIRSFLKQ